MTSPTAGNHQPPTSAAPSPYWSCMRCEVDWKADEGGTSCWLCGHPGQNGRVKWASGAHLIGKFPPVEYDP